MTFEANITDVETIEERIVSTGGRISGLSKHIGKTVYVVVQKGDMRDDGQIEGTISCNGGLLSAQQELGGDYREFADPTTIEIVKASG